MDFYRAVFLLGLLISPLKISAQTTCDSSYIGVCISSAIVNACGDLTETACACGASGRAQIGTIAGACLITRCPLTQILAIGNFGFSACDEWLSTHTLSPTGAGQGPATTTSSLPSSTPFISTTSASAGQMSITSSPTAATSPLAATNTSAPSLSVGAEVGIGVGAFALLCLLILSFVFWLRYRRSKRRPSSSHAPLSPHNLQPGENLYELADKSSIRELQTGENIHELPDKSVELSCEPVVEIPLRELAGFQFPFQKRADSPVEADSRSARAGLPRGRQAGTEATAFDFENQKVLLTPNLRSTSKGSASPSRSLRQRNMDT